MRIASAAVAVFGAVLLLISLAGDRLSLIIPLATLALAGILFLARSVSIYLTLLISLVSAVQICLTLIHVLRASGLVSPDLVGEPSVAMPIAATVFVGVLLAISRIPVIRTIMSLTDPYFESRDVGTLQLWPFGRIRAQERWIGLGLVAVVIALQFALVAISVRFNYWNRDWFNAIQEKNGEEFWRLLLTVWVFWVVVFVVVAIYQYVLQSTLEIRWRAWLTDFYTARWLGDANHYRMTILGGQTDNPDQRIQEDVRKFTSTTMSFTLRILSQVSTLVSFSVILWSISADFTLPGTDIVVPGLLFWIALVYAAGATIVTHLIGRPLIRLNFLQERYEADFRFGLARLREYGEQVALLEGEKAERQRLGSRFDRVIDNWYQLIAVTKRLIAFTSFYENSNSVVPFVFAAPFYFSGKIALGVMTQVASAFGRVEGALSFFINFYQSLADYKAVIDRLTSFEDSMARARKVGAAQAFEFEQTNGPDLSVSDLRLDLPNGRTIVRAHSLTFRAGEATLLVGPSGSGKSTLFRAIAGIWPFGEGRIETPAGATMMLLPQRPYIPMGTLKGAVAYPALDGAYDDATVIAALQAVRLNHLVERLDEEEHWTHVLSLGEQQRLAITRALLARPDWLFLDEATAALDEPTEAEVYRVIREILPDTTIVSIGHRSTLAEFHDRRIEMRPGEGGISEPVARQDVVAAQ
ncbi:ABC transporter ATP-binding protein/permease [Microvirga massiliensis]|uniref:ABC transporter ATP-binding protein/permease n=1 Tax=Microvirga massiliensis TaxID=1033741 RepID=UPI0009E22E9D|nr:ABC transporter ATP-binding protein/permease [Microvirga massiliensis]